MRCSMGKRKRFSFVLSNNEKELLTKISKEFGDISLASALRRIIFDAENIKNLKQKELRSEDEK